MPKAGAPWDDVPESRRKTMRAVKGKDTKPEMIVRWLVHGMGYRYRLHRKDLPGKPDLAFGPRKKAVFVHGCFWHQHAEAGCRRARMPFTRSQYWRAKLERNKDRDVCNITSLKQLGWDVLVVWECSLRDTNRTAAILRAFLDGPGKVSLHG